MFRVRVETCSPDVTLCVLCSILLFFADILSIVRSVRRQQRKREGRRKVIGEAMVQKRHKRRYTDFDFALRR